MRSILLDGTPIWVSEKSNTSSRTIDGLTSAPRTATSTDKRSVWIVTTAATWSRPLCYMRVQTPSRRWSTCTSDFVSGLPGELSDGDVGSSM